LPPFNVASFLGPWRDSPEPTYIPRRVVRPNTQLIIDTTYPTHLYRNFNPEDDLSASIDQPDFVTINGTRTRKRRAEDTELDLVLANEGSTTVAQQEPVNDQPAYHQPTNDQLANGWLQIQPSLMRPRFMLDSIHQNWSRMMGGVRNAFASAKEALLHAFFPIERIKWPNFVQSRTAMCDLSV
jgi:hypothetical protein